MKYIAWWSYLFFFTIYLKYFSECYTKPGTKDTCICPPGAAYLQGSFTAMCHDQEPIPKVTCKHNGKSCECLMPDPGELYHISCAVPEDEQKTSK